MSSPLMRKPSERRVESPPGGSTLITSAPMSASTWPQNGPAITCVSSRTRTSSSAVTPGSGSRSSTSSAACTPGSIGTPASRSPISTPHSVPASIRSLKSPRWPMRKIRPCSLPRPAPSDMSKRSRITRRTSSASWPSGSTTPVSTAEYSRGSAHSTSRPQRLDRRARRRRVAGVAGEDGRQPLLAQHRERLAQPVEQVRGRRVGPEAGLVGLDDRPPVPVGARQPRAARRPPARAGRRR